MIELRFNSFSRFTKRNPNLEHDRYEWCVFIDEPCAALEEIREVQYVLHPEFPDPTRVVRDARHSFALLSNGWGGFLIRIRVIFRSGAIGRQQYMLQLRRDAWPMGPVLEEFSDDVEERIYSSLLNDDPEWRTLSKLKRVAAAPESDIRERLSVLETARYVRKHYEPARVSGDERWAATSRVGALPEPGDAVTG